MSRKSSKSKQDKIERLRKEIVNIFREELTDEQFQKFACEFIGVEALVDWIEDSIYEETQVETLEDWLSFVKSFKSDDEVVVECISSKDLKKVGKCGEILDRLINCLTREGIAIEDFAQFLKGKIDLKVSGAPLAIYQELVDEFQKRTGNKIQLRYRNIVQCFWEVLKKKKKLGENYDNKTV